MSPYEAYWRQRLDSLQIFHNPNGRKPGVDYLGFPSRWPTWVSRYAMWTDYVGWHEEVWAPVHGGELGRVSDFFSALKPWLYDEYHNQSATSWPVVVPQFRDGRWVNVQVRRRFVGLLIHEEAKALFKRRIDARNKK